MIQLGKYIIGITICLLLTTAISCTHIATMNKSSPKFPELKKGNLISIVFIDLTQLKCVFLEKTENDLLVRITENGEHIQRLVDINSVLRIDKLKRKPPAIMTIAVVLVILSLVVWLGNNVGFIPGS